MIKIISGGQTGVDRGALDAALDANVDCGGWCPSGRLAEDGEIPEKYPLEELESRSYKDRTLKNVVDSDGTVIFYFGELEGGTKLTSLFCEQQGKPYLSLLMHTKLMYNGLPNSFGPSHRSIPLKSLTLRAHGRARSNRLTITLRIRLRPFFKVLLSRSSLIIVHGYRLTI